MGKFSGVLLASDFDDTLIAHDGSFPARNAAALDYFIREGGRFTLATGRGHAPVRRLLERGLPINAPVIETNGTRIYDFQAGRELYAAALDPSILPIVERLLAEHPDLCAECFAGDGIYAQQPNVCTRFHSERIGLEIPERTLREEPMPWVKVLLQHPSHEALLPIQERVLAEGRERFEAVFSVPTFLEVFGVGSSKGIALCRLAELLGVRPEDTYAVGDGDNDVAMLSAVESFCCANGSDGAKAAATHLVGDCDHGAIADVIEWLDRKYAGSAR